MRHLERVENDRAVDKFWLCPCSLFTLHPKQSEHGYRNKTELPIPVEVCASFDMFFKIGAAILITSIYVMLAFGN